MISDHNKLSIQEIEERYELSPLTGLEFAGTEDEYRCCRCSGCPIEIDLDDV